MSVNFIMTSFMYPLDKNDRTKIFGNLYFDNPRTTEEIEYVADYLKKINKSERPCFADRPGLVPDDCITLMTIYDEFFENNKDILIVREFYEKNKRIKNIYKKLAKMLIVIRTDKEENESEDCNVYFTIVKKKDKNERDLEQKRRISPIEYDKDKINGYFSFITFIFDGGLQNGLLKDEISEINYFKHDVFIRWLVMSHIKKSDTEKGNYPYGLFNHIKPRIINLSNAVGEKYDSKKFIYICKKINHILELYHINEEMCFVELIGLIEMLITHNPDSGKYNIEDSITKQFVGKMTLLLYENDKSIELEKIDKELRFAYKIRSAIAHGNFGSLEKELKKLFAFYNLGNEENNWFYRKSEDSLGKLIDRTFDWLRIIINLYLMDEKRLEIIKNM